MTLRTRRVCSRFLALGAACLALLAVTPSRADAGQPSARATSAPSVGLLSPTAAQLTMLAPAVLSRVVVPLGWNYFEPAAGVFSAAAVADATARIGAATRHGEQVVLDLGLQYPPSWVFGLPGQTRFVDQHGDVWHGDLGTDAPNAVFNAAVRSAEGGYLHFLGTALASTPVAAVRVGGLLSGELRYPPDRSAGADPASLWDYDPAAQARSPVPGWRPGQGSAADASAALDFYFASLTGYQTWLMRTVHDALPDTQQQVLLPGWGIRPGTETGTETGTEAGTVAASGSGAPITDVVGAGLDWDRQVRAIARTGYDAVVYCTWLDAPVQGTGPRDEPPIAYLAALAARYGLALGGENTGGGGVSALQQALRQGRAYGLTSVMYMSGNLIADGRAGLTLPTLQSVVSTFLGS